jgi:hypothetical protein
MANTTFLPFEENWNLVKAKIVTFLENIEGGMNKDSYKIPAKEFVAVYKCARAFFFNALHLFDVTRSSMRHFARLNMH